MDSFKNIRINMSIFVHPDIDAAIEKAGFESRSHFFKQAARALLAVYLSGEKLEWPIELKTQT